MADWLALLVALFAIFMTWRESKRNHAVWLAVDDCVSDGSQSMRENNRQLFHRFMVRIRNKGIPLYGLSSAICFRGEDGSGTITFPLQRNSLAGDRDEFGKGMIAEFHLKSYEMPDSHKIFLASIKSTWKQGATLNFYSQNYLCASFPIYTRTTWLKRKWNWIAWRFNFVFQRRAGRSREGHDIIYTPTVLPLFKIDLDRLSDFIRTIKRELKIEGESNVPNVTKPHE